MINLGTVVTIKIDAEAYPGPFERFEILLPWPFAVTEGVASTLSRRIRGSCCNIRSSKSTRIQAGPKIIDTAHRESWMGSPPKMKAFDVIDPAALIKGWLLSDVSRVPVVPYS